MQGIEYPPAAVVGRPGRRLTELRRIRERRALSQAELAERSGVARATIVSIESGRAGAQYGTIRKIAEALGVEPEELLAIDTGGYYSGAFRYLRDRQPSIEQFIRDWDSVAFPGYGEAMLARLRQGGFVLEDQGRLQLTEAGRSEYARLARLNRPNHEEDRDG
jgi:transcriptional regulator with XRE-family HTH domain